MEIPALERTVKAELEFVYVGDPMCSWCWGFAPVLERMQAVYDIPIRVVVGGLRPGPDAEVLDDRLQGFLGHHWDQVEQASGQPFDHAFLERRDGWRYDTELPATAVVVMRSMDEKMTLPFHTRLQQAFYAEGMDITDQEQYAALVDGFDVDPEEFGRRLESDETKRRTWNDFAEARSLGITGFPALLISDGEQQSVVTRGFMPADKLLPALSDWLLGQYGDAEGGLFCEPGVTC